MHALGHKTPHRGARQEISQKKTRGTEATVDRLQRRLVATAVRAVPATNDSPS
jgi:hypothetical protein